jgi:hypothetical protein
MVITAHIVPVSAILPSQARKGTWLTAAHAVRFLFCAALLISQLACLHKSPLRRETINREMDEMASSIARNPGNIAALKEKRFGGTGYVYALDRDGTVIYHPQTALAGMNFAGNPLVRHMLELKSGCLVQYFEGMDKLMVFRPAGDGGIVCLTISLAEIEGDRTGCEELK